MTQDEMKYAAAKEAISYITKDSIVGVGTGSTANFFIDELAKIKQKIKGAVASSLATSERLSKYNIPIFDLNDLDTLSIYVDGADEADENLYLIKGGGGALTREKILTASAKQFICIIDETKLVKTLGKFPLPVEVIPMSINYVTKKITKLTGAKPILRKNFITDNGNIILDINHLKITNALHLEAMLNHITGVVTNGLFARRNADILLISTENGVVRHVKK